jgi:hypothetical protein
MLKIKPPYGSVPPSHNINECEPKSTVQKNLDGKIPGMYFNEESFDRFCLIVKVGLIALLLLLMGVIIGILL